MAGGGTSAWMVGNNGAGLAIAPTLKNNAQVKPARRVVDRKGGNINGQDFIGLVGFGWVTLGLGKSRQKIV